jgi:outer membrane protein
MFLFNTQKVIGLVIYTVFAGQVVAQDRLSLSECISMAIEQNLKIKESELGLQSTINTHQQTKRDRLPSVEGIFNPGYSLGRSIDPYTNSITNNQIGTNSAWIKADWLVYNGYQRKNTQEQAAMNLSASQLDVQASKNVIVLNVLQAYMQILMSKELLNVAFKQAESTQMQLDRTTKQVKLEVAAESTLFSLEAQLANDQIQITNARNDLRIAHLTLGQLLNRPVGENEFELDPIEDSLVTFTNGTWKDVYEQSLTVLPEVQAMGIRIKSAEKSIDIAKGLKHPTLSLSSSFGTAFSSMARRSVVMGENYVETPINAFVNVDGETYQASTFSQSVEQQRIGYFNQLGLNRAFSISLTVRVPIFNATQSSYKTQEAKIQKMIVKNQDMQVRQQLRQQVEQAFITLQNAAERYRTLQVQVQVLEKALRASEIRLTNGVTNPLEYTMAKTNLDRAKATFVQTKYEVTVRKKVLDFYGSGGIEF